MERSQEQCDQAKGRSRQWNRRIIGIQPISYSTGLVYRVALQQRLRHGRRTQTRAWPPEDVVQVVSQVAGVFWLVVLLLVHFLHSTSSSGKQTCYTYIDALEVRVYVKKDAMFV